MKPDPVTVTTVPPLVGPFAGETLVTVSPPPYVKMLAEVPALGTPFTHTMTNTWPA